MKRYAMPHLSSGEEVLFTQRAYFPVPGTRLSAIGVLLVLTNARLLFAPRRLMGVPGLGESAVRRRSIDLRDIIGVEPVAEAAIRVRTKSSGGTLSVRILPPEGAGFIWSVRQAAPYRDETVRRIREACSRAGT